MGDLELVAAGGDDLVAMVDDLVVKGSLVGKGDLAAGGNDLAGGDGGDGGGRRQVPLVLDLSYLDPDLGDTALYLFLL